MIGWRLSLILIQKKRKNAANSFETKNKPKKPTRIAAKEFSNLMNKEEMGINKELFIRFFSFQRATAMLKAVCNTDNKKKNRD